MKLNNVKLFNFKNYETLSLEFSKDIICFVGENGEGKTNLLDAIFYVCIGKGYFHSQEKYNRRHQQDFLRIEGQFVKNDKVDLIAVVSQDKVPKKVEKNKVAYDRVSEHLGYAPVCFIAPDDSVILQGGSEYRRKFLDTTLSQMSKKYVRNLIEYNRILKQRNLLLKQERPDISLLKIYDEQLAPLGTAIYHERNNYIQQLSARAKNIYENISQEKEEISCTYKSKLHDADFAELLTQNKQKDLILRRTSVGIHRDDLALLINDYELKKVGSQGQQKTAVLALKLAEFELLTEYSQQPPILLLDDIFDKLDAGRVEQLFSYITQNYKSQLFLTDTDGERLNELLKKFNRKFEIFTVKQNNLQPYAEK